MSLETIASRLTGYVTALPKPEAYNLVNEAWKDIRNDRLWSFQLAEDGIASPAVISTGTVTATLGSATVTCDAAASAALTGLTNPVVTQRQFRIQGYTIYDIVGFDTTVPTACVITLNRPFVDVAGLGLSYLCYQCYYTAPVKDFKRWLDWRDMTNGVWLSIFESRREVNISDPKRLYFSFPYYVLGYQTDQRTGSSTPGWMRYELYPNPLSVVTYMRWYLRTGADLVNPADTVPEPITEELVFFRARVRAYEWAESNKRPDAPRGSGADYKFLAQAAMAEYTRELRIVGMKDRDLIELFVNQVHRFGARKGDYYSSIIGRAFGQGRM